jgi:hypothetical protein
MTSDSMVASSPVPLTTAAEVSSQEVSMPRTCKKGGKKGKRVKGQKGRRVKG